MRGIPLPPRFDAARIRGASLVQTAATRGAVTERSPACGSLMESGSRDRRYHDPQARDPAMATAPRWPILREMARQGAWTQVLISYAKAMPTGTVQLNRGAPGLPLTRAANSGFGCGPSWGIPLGQHGSTAIVRSTSAPLSGHRDAIRATIPAASENDCVRLTWIPPPPVRAPVCAEKGAPLVGPTASPNPHSRRPYRIPARRRMQGGRGGEDG